MKAFLIVFSLLGVMFFGISDSGVESKVYSFSKVRAEKTETGIIRQLIDNSTTHFENFEIHSLTIEPGKIIDQSPKYLDFERLIIVKEGHLRISIEGKSSEMSQGSVALILPNDKCEIKNTGSSQSSYYSVNYKSKLPVDIQRGISSGGSMLLAWDSIRFSPHDKGGIRKYFDRKSAMSERIEMHVTTLNPQIKSHEPHTHFPAEIVIMMEGKTEMQIGDKIYPGEVGDIYFLESNISHAIRNTGETPCLYMAFQWQ